MSIGDRIRGLRSHKKMSQIELAKAVGITQGTLSKIEKGHSIPPSDLVRRLAHTLGADGEQLIRMVDAPSDGAVQVDYWFDKFDTLANEKKFSEILTLVEECSKKQEFQSTSMILFLSFWEAYGLHGYNKWDDAIAKALMIVPELWRTKEKAYHLVVYDFLAAGYVMRHEYQSALKYLKLAEDLIPHIHLKYIKHVISVYWRFNIAYTLQKDLDKAEHYLDKAMSLIQSQSSVFIRRKGDTMRLRAYILLKNKETFREGLATMGQAISYYKMIGSLYDILPCYVYLGEAHKKHGNKATGETFFRRSLDLIERHNVMLHRASRIILENEGYIIPKGAGD